MRAYDMLPLVPVRLSVGVHKDGEGAEPFTKPDQDFRGVRRLMCCLQYEYECYECTRKLMPDIGREVVTEDGPGVVLENNIITDAPGSRSRSRTAPMRFVNIRSGSLR